MRTHDHGSIGARAVAADPRILVVSRHRMVGEALSTALHSLGFRTGSVELPRGRAQLQDVRRSISAVRPAVGVVLVPLDDGAGLRSALNLVSSIELPWIVVTGSRPGPAWGAVLEAGALEVSPASLSLTDLAGLVVRATSTASGDEHAMRDLVVQEWQCGPPTMRSLATRMAGLSPREMDVLVELGRGNSPATIASDAGVSQVTVRTQVKSLLRKLGFTSQLQAVAAYRELNDWLRG